MALVLIQYQFDNGLFAIPASLTLISIIAVQFNNFWSSPPVLSWLDPLYLHPRLLTYWLSFYHPLYRSRRYGADPEAAPSEYNGSADSESSEPSSPKRRKQRRRRKDRHLDHVIIRMPASSGEDDSIYPGSYAYRKNAPMPIGMPMKDKLTGQWHSAEYYRGNPYAVPEKRRKRK